MTDEEELTAEVLADLCVEKTRPMYSPDVEFFTDHTRIEARKVDPPWLVIVPSRNLGTEGFSVCTMGGTASAPVFEAESVVTTFTEQEVEDAINGVEYYRGD